MIPRFGSGFEHEFSENSLKNQKSDPVISLQAGLQRATNLQLNSRTNKKFIDF